VHDTIGIDLVAMPMNDLVVQGAEPLYFLDHYGCGKLDIAVAAEVLKAQGRAVRKEALPSLAERLQPGGHNVAGFAVGAVERAQLLPRNDIAQGDLIKVMVHITGAHFVDNVPRAHPVPRWAHRCPRWALPPVLHWVMRAGAIAAGEMVRTFNCGIGMVLVVAEDKVSASVQAGQKEVYTIGEVVASPRVEILNTDL